MERDFSVLMSIYYKEKADYVSQCFDSLMNQTVKATEWVIVEDGPLNEEVYKLLDFYQDKYPGLIKRIRLINNCGLGISLAKGIEQCSNELIARMDTDDIARHDRFEKQLREFDKNPNLDICGSNIDEFEDDPSCIVAHRVVPLTDSEIKEYQKRRDAFNHMTVMYKKHAVLSAGNYQPCPLMEDTYLWVRMMINGVICKNIGEPLVLARIGKEMYSRRGGWTYFLKYRNGRKMVFETGFIKKWDYYYTLIAQLAVSIMPGTIRGWIYKSLLH